MVLWLASIRAGGVVAFAVAAVVAVVAAFVVAAAVAASVVVAAVAVGVAVDAFADARLLLLQCRRLTLVTTGRTTVMFKVVSAPRLLAMSTLERENAWRVALIPPSSTLVDKAAAAKVCVIRGAHASATPNLLLTTV